MKKLLIIFVFTITAYPQYEGYEPIFIKVCNSNGCDFVERN